MRTVKALLIDPEKRSISKVKINIGDDDGLEEIYALLQCRDITDAAHLSGSISKGFDSILASDDPLEDGDDPRFWFQVDADRNPPRSHPIPGFGLACGADSEGAMCDVRITAKELAARITYTHRKFRGFEVEHGRRGDGVIISVISIAPIIDD